MASILSLIIGGVAGMIKFLAAKHMEFKHQQQMALMAKAGLEYKDRNRAGKVTDKGVSFTRRILAFIFAAALTAPVFYGLLNPEATISVPQTFIEKGFWDIILPWKNGHEVTKYVEVKALVIATPIYDICAMIIGFYFGSGGSRARQNKTPYAYAQKRTRGYSKIDYDYTVQGTLG